MVDQCLPLPRLFAVQHLAMYKNMTSTLDAFLPLPLSHEFRDSSRHHWHRRYPNLPRHCKIEYLLTSYQGSYKNVISIDVGYEAFYNTA